MRGLVKYTRLGIWITVSSVLVLSLAGCGAKSSTPSSGADAGARAGAEQGAGGGSQAQGGSVTIGVIGDFSGPFAPYSSASFQGASIAVEEINAAGGVRGKTIQLKQYDDKNDPVEAVNIAKRIGDEALAVIVASPSSPTLAMGPVLDRAGIPFITTVSSNPAVTESGWKYVNRMHLSDRDQVRRLIDYAVNEQKFNRIGILYDTSDLGVGGYKMAVEALKEHGLQPVVAEGWRQTDVDFGGIVLKVKQAGAQGVILWGNVEGAVRIVQQMRGAGLNNVQVYGGGGLVTQKYIELGGKTVEGTIATWAYVDPSVPKAAELAKKYQEKFKRQMDVFVAQSYDAMHILAQAINQAGTSPKDRDAIQNAIRATKYDGAVGHIEFDKNGHNIRKIYLAQLRDGKYNVIE